MFRTGRMTQSLPLSFSSAVVGRVVPALSSELTWVALQDAIAARIAFRLAAGIVVVVVAPRLDALAGTGGMSASTGRNRSCAVRPTSRSALAWSFTPGSSTMMSLPWRLMLGSATPKLFTRLFMMFRVSVSAPGFGLPTGW